MAWGVGMIEKLQPSDGGIRIATVSGVSVLVAVIALLMGVLPVFASHPASAVTPVVIDVGGGSGKCSAEVAGRLPSVAGNEFHINNPTPGVHSNGTIQITVYDLPEGRVFDFTVLDAGFVVYDVVVNGGPKSNHYDYDRDAEPSDGDVQLHAPRKSASSLHNLSHINICYDVPGLTFFTCDTPETLTEETGLFRSAEATIFANSLHDCTDKEGQFMIENQDDPPTVTLAFEDDGTDIVTGRLDVTKDFGDPALFFQVGVDGFGQSVDGQCTIQDDPTQQTTVCEFPDLQYDGPGEFVDVQWCAVRSKDAGDGDEFDDVLSADKYPSLVGVSDVRADGSTQQATACKVFEAENAEGIQHTVVYFELQDPQWR